MVARIIAALVASTLIAGCGGGPPPPGFGEPTAVDKGDGHTFVLAVAVAADLPSRDCAAIAEAEYWASTSADPSWTTGFYGGQIAVISGPNETRSSIASIPNEPVARTLSLRFAFVLGSVSRVELRGISPPGATTSWGGASVVARCED